MTNGLTRKQFDILVKLAEMRKPSAAGQGGVRSIYPAMADEALTKLTEAGYVGEGGITSAGLYALEPYRAKRAVFLAAGYGSRLAPVTINTPKPLVRIHGKRIIDGLIDACLGAGIGEIYIVRGYLAEQFDQLLYQYPMVRFLENPAYSKANNISSAMCAVDLLANAYMLEADLLVKNPNVIRPYHYTSDFLAFWKGQTDDWCFEVENGVITGEKIGGTDCWQMVGISYWDGRDGGRLARDIRKVYEQPGGKGSYWEQVPLVHCRENYRVEVCACGEGDVTEIDTFGELKAVDPAYGL